MPPAAVQNEHLYARLAPSVRKVVSARLRWDQDIEDSIHEAFIQIFVHVKSLRDPSCLEAWSERIANNVVNGVIRKRERHRRHSASYELATINPSYHHDWIGHSFASRVIDMLGRLPSRDHTVLWQYWFEPLTRDQMAALANCSPSKMARRIRRARARFDVLARRDPYVSRLLRDR